jgi:hypothetical protein
MLIKEIKIDFVIDPLANKVTCKQVTFKNKHSLAIDTLNNISSNILCTLISRTEPKDYVDYYFIMKKFKSYSLDKIFINARAKDAIFDDPATAAFQLEEGLYFIKKNYSLLPQLSLPLNKKDFFAFFEEIAQWLYAHMKV